MATVNAEIEFQDNNDAFFTTNAAVIYDAGIQIFHVDGRYKFGDGVTALSALPFRGASSGGSWGSITGTLSAQTDLQNALNNKEPLKGTDDNYVTDAQLTVIQNTSGTNTGDETAARIGAITNGSTDYPTPLDADKIGVWDVANSLFKALTLANLKATLKTYFDTLYSSGSLYIPNVWISPNFTTKVTGSGWNGTAWFVPFFVAKQTTITELGIEVTTGVAASTIRIGLFSADSSGNVGTLIDQTGTMSSVSTGVKSTIISQSIASGLYYLGFQSSAAGVAVRQGNVVSNINEIGGTGAAVLRSTLAYGPFSSNPTVTFTAQTNAPYLLFKTS